MTRRRRKDSGLALLLVLILVASATVLGVSYATTTTVKLVSTENLRKAGRARYLAESGIHHGLYLLRTNPRAMDGSDSTLLGPYSADASTAEYTFGSAAVVGQTDQYVVTGRATADGVTQTVTMKVQMDSQYTTVLNALGPIHHWRLGESMTTDRAADTKDDWEGHYKDGTGRGWIGAIEHDSDTAAHFDGFDDRVELHDGLTKLDIPGKAMTLLAWIYPDRHNHLSGKNARILCKSKHTSVQDTFWSIHTGVTSGQVRLVFRLKTHNDQEEAEEEKEGTTTKLAASTGEVPLNQWTLAVATYDGAHMRIYQDGELVGSRAKTGFITLDDGKKVWIGGDPDDKKDRPWCGKIDEVAIFNRTLSAEQIQSLYDNRYPAVRKLAWDE